MALVRENVPQPRVWRIVYDLKDAYSADADFVRIEADGSAYVEVSVLSGKPVLLRPSELRELATAALEAADGS